MYSLYAPTDLDYEMDKKISKLNLSENCLKAYDSIGMAFKHSILKKYNSEHGIKTALGIIYKNDPKFCEDCYKSEQKNREKRWSKY